MISPVRYHDREGSPGVEEVLKWEGYVEKSCCYTFLTFGRCVPK